MPHQQISDSPIFFFQWLLLTRSQRLPLKINCIANSLLYDIGSNSFRAYCPNWHVVLLWWCPHSNQQHEPWLQQVLNFHNLLTNLYFALVFVASTIKIWTLLWSWSSFVYSLSIVNLFLKMTCCLWDFNLVSFWCIHLHQVLAIYFCVIHLLGLIQRVNDAKSFN